MPTVGYVEALHAWQARMDAEIRADNTWLSWVGDFWLKEGVNTLGSSPDCDIALPQPAPRILGAVTLERAGATFKADVGQTVELNGEPLHSATPLKSEDEDFPSLITFKSISLRLVRRDNRVGLRLWDNLHARALPPRTWFEVNEKFRFRAMYTPYPAPVKVELPNVLGKMESGYVQGYISFKVDGKSHNLDAAELDDGRLYIQFKDLTSGVKTFPAGRYLQTEPVLDDGQVIVDFNKAHNPPAAFKDDAPSTFAHKGNHLKVAIEAGELYLIRHYMDQWNAS
jgi:uncharacterized protein (DUF1684 family)